jgi:aspartyl-tRNA(Asn)/glutamyl-tRNA(Gln) amidotransferase subunit A
LKLTPAELSLLDATTIAREVNAGRLSPVEITRAALTAIEIINPVLHPFTEVAADQAIDSARRIEAALAVGGEVGPLAGVPVPIKDLVLTKGLRTTFGSKLYEHYVPDTDDIAVERLRAAGAIIIGKTNVAEFGYGGIGHNPVFPTTRNPWNPELTSGGSSAGSAVAVATGIAPVAIGSDGGGSIRLPAAFNGLFGMKASMGRVPLWPGCRDETLPGVSGWESVEHVGPISRTVADAALLLSVITGPDPRDRHSIPCSDIDWLASARATETLGLRIAYCADWGGRPLDREVRAICDAAARAFASELGAIVEETPPPFGWEIEAFRTIVAADTDIAGLRRMIAETGSNVAPKLQMLLDNPPTADAIIDARHRRRAACNAMARFMANYDLLLTPTVACLPFPIDRDGPGTIDGQPVADDEWTPAEFPSNFTGQPTASVPAGWTTRALPVGLQVIGRHLADATVLNASAAWERAHPWSHRRPKPLALALA